MASSSGMAKISMAQRLEILDKLEKGVSTANVAREYGISAATVRRYRQNTQSIRQFASDAKNLKKSRRRQRIYTEIEIRLYNWFVQRRLQGGALNDHVVVEKAKEIAVECNNIYNFKASKGWLWNWKKKYDVRFVKNNGEPVESDEDAANSFMHEFAQLLTSREINNEDIYNMGECGLLWKFLPRKMLIQNGGRVLTDKTKKEKVTVGVCANANGTHKLPLLFIHKYANSRALKQHKHTLPVTYKNQPNGWINEELFRDWYSNDFKTAVRQRQLEHGRTGNVVLLINNFRRHKLTDNETDDGQFKLMFLPCNSAALIQPMDQGIITKLKLLFRHKLIQKVLQCGEGINTFFTNYNMKHCIDFISESWNEITRDSIFDAWAKILKRPQLTNTDCSQHEGNTEYSNIASDNKTEIRERFSECVQAELDPSEIVKTERKEEDDEKKVKQEDEDFSPSSPMEDTDIDLFLSFLRKLMKTEPRMKDHAKAIINYYDKKD
nr:PREDICTED: jerky protein homolog-like [Megachile rotundata]